MASVDADPLIATLLELGGAGLLVHEFGASAQAPKPNGRIVQLGVHRTGPLPCDDLEVFDILLSAEPDAPAPWVGAGAQRLDAMVDGLRAAVAAQPAAAGVAAQVFRMTLGQSFDQALMLESLAYSMLLASRGFRGWRAATPIRAKLDDAAPRVIVAQTGAMLEICLNRAAARNAFDARMRDELVEALTFALDHPDAPDVILSGAGPGFSAGGDLDEFGRASDPAIAHLIRTLRSPARLAHELGPRLTARLHGACVGAGIEVPAGAGKVIARSGAVFRLPEVSMGLIPGAGGTATIPRRIGRQRACYMTLSGVELDAAAALAWGLVDQVEA